MRAGPVRHRKRGSPPAGEVPPADRPGSAAGDRDAIPVGGGPREAPSGRPAKDAATGGAARLQPLKSWFGRTWLREVLRRLGALDFLSSSVLFGASLLLSVLPCIILFSGLADERVDDDISRHLGLSQGGERIVSDLFTHPHVSFNLGIFVSLLLGVAGTIAVAESVQSIYEKVFGQPHERDLRTAVRWVIWVGALVAVAILDAQVSGPIRDAGGGAILLGLVTFVGASATFLWSMHFLLWGRVPWRRLVRPALVSGAFWVGLGVVASVYFSATIVSDSKIYGTIGVVFTLVSWFIAMGAVIIIGAVVGTVWQDRVASARRR